MYRTDSISITPVANGFVVTLPSVEVDQTTQMLDSLSKGLPNIMEKMQADPTLSRLQNEMNEEIKSIPQLELMRDTSTHVFTDFIDVLAFLSERFIKK